jgi:hypothetical protein
MYFVMTAAIGQWQADEELAKDLESRRVEILRRGLTNKTKSYALPLSYHTKQAIGY